MKNLLMLLLLLVAVVFMSQGCYYDNEEELYPNQSCDTSSVSYSATIVPILITSCYSCHNNANAADFGNGVSFEGHANISQYLTTSSTVFINCINQTAGYPAMPPTSAKLSDCNIKKIEIWINGGFPNN